MTFDDDDDAEIISKGPTSIVTRIESDSRFIAVKTATTVHAKEPHDIIKEARVLASLSNPHIVPLIKHQISERTQSLSLWMPYISYSLDELLHSFRFSPYPIISFGNTTSPSPSPRATQFVVLAKSIIFQVLCGVNYLHSELVQIAHRDIKPSNVLLTPSGCAKLIDFGIAFRVGEDLTAKARDLWPESTARMYFEVSTGPYRAPELLFGTRTYDAFAIDAWSLGATFAEFFTSLRLQTEDDSDDENIFSRSNRTPAPPDPDARAHSPPPPMPFVIPRDMRTRPTGRWTRTSLFDATRGEIGLAWSIFKIRGTPNPDTWPSFLTLPDASKLSFVDVPATDLASQLPNLPPPSSSVTRATSSDLVSSPLDLVRRFLAYEPAQRLRASEALGHPWFRDELGLVLPADLEDHMTSHPLRVSESETGAVTRSITLEGQTRTIGDLLQTYVPKQSSTSLSW